MAKLAAYGPNPNAGINVNDDHGWGGYKWPGGVPSNLLGTAAYGKVRSIVRVELVELFSLAYRLAADKYGYTIHTTNPNGNGEPWGPWGYENRKIAGSNTASNHSKGKANDWNAPYNPYASGSLFTSDFPVGMVHDLESVLLCWGGRYGDSMHWEYGGTPGNVAGSVAKLKALIGGAGTTIITPAQPAKPAQPIVSEDESMRLNTVKVQGKDGIFAYGPGIWRTFTDTEALGVGIALGYYGPTVETNQRGLDVIKQEAFNTTPDAREWSGK